MITFDAKKFMKALDNYVGFRSMTPPTERSIQREREAEAQLLEQLKVLEDTAKTADRLLLAQVEIAGLVEVSVESLMNSFDDDGHLLPLAARQQKALESILRALSVLADLGEESDGSKKGPGA